jgi:hypothetical protein
MSEEVSHARKPPFSLDPLAHPRLADKLPPKFAEVNSYDWGMVVGAMSDSWDEPITIEGIDWKVTLCPPGSLAIPTWTGTNASKTRMTRVRRHAAMFAVSLKKTDANEARDLGRPRVRSLVGLLRREIPMIMPSAVLWEGLLGIRGKKKSLLMLAIDVDIRPDRTVTQSNIQDLRMRLLQLKLQSAPDAAMRALEWMTAARRTSTAPEQLVNLWLAVIALIKPGQPADALDPDRIHAYTDRLRRTNGGPYGDAIVEELTGRLLAAKKARERLMHRDELRWTTPELLDELEGALFSMIDFELLRAGLRMS